MLSATVSSFSKPTAARRVKANPLRIRPYERWSGSAMFEERLDVDGPALRRVLAEEHDVNSGGIRWSLGERDRQIQRRDRVRRQNERHRERLTAPTTSSFLLLCYMRWWVSESAAASGFCTAMVASKAENNFRAWLSSTYWRCGDAAISTIGVGI